MKRKTMRLAAGIGSTMALLAGTLAALVALSGPAAAVNNNPAGNPTSPAVSYESDCVGSGAAAGQVAPFVTSTVINTTTDTALPTTATFGVAGAVSQTLAGAVVAAFNGALNPATYSLTGTMTFGSTDGHATGTYVYTSPNQTLPNPGGQVTGVSYGSGSTTLTGDFSAAAAGDAVLDDPIGSQTGIPADAVITAVNGTTSATISVPTTAAGSGAIVGYAPAAGLTFTDSSFASPANAFTTSGTNGQTAGIGVISTSVFTVGAGAVPLTFGGSPGVGTTNCLETGWVDATTPGPAQTGQTGPRFPFGVTTPLVSATPTFQPGAYVNLVQPLPTANSLTVNLGVGGTKNVLLPVAASPNQTITSCNLVGAVSNPRLAVNITNTATTCTAALTDSGSGPATVTFQYTVSDTYPQTSAPATVTVSVGTPPVDQPIGQDVLPGQLVLSCSAPGAAGYPALQCPIINLPAITLNGVEQTTTGAANTIYVSDNRGDPTVGWTLTTYMVPTSSTLQTNATCTSLTNAAVFCNSSVGSNASNANGQIAATNLSISAPTCGVAAGNLNPAPTAGAGGAYGGSPIDLCSATAGQSGGTFTMNSTFSLKIPASVYAGQYYGTVEYLVS